MPVVLVAPPPVPRFSRAAAVLAVALVALVALLIALGLLIRWGQFKLVQRRVNHSVDIESRVDGGGVCLGSAKVKKGSRIDISPSTILERARLALPVLVTATPAPTCPRSSSSARIAKLQGPAVKPARLIARPVRVPIGPSPLRIVFVVSIVECVEEATRHVPCALAFDYLFATSFMVDDDDDNDEDDVDDAVENEMDVSFWTSRSNEVKFTITKPPLKRGPVLLPWPIYQPTRPDSSVTAVIESPSSLLGPATSMKFAGRPKTPTCVDSAKDSAATYPSSPLRPTGTTRAIGVFKTPSKDLTVAPGKENKRKLASIPRHRPFRIG
ncbi:hypothetical protein B0H11DRAFT_2214212 [Mycena galericulata]|nr:hypothetical protein B0H11DRAFT_2214212 [Mycena galericulata]